MYKYDAIDQQIVNERVAQYRDQTNRYLSGELSEDEFGVKKIASISGIGARAYWRKLGYKLQNSYMIKK